MAQMWNSSERLLKTLELPPLPISSSSTYCLPLIVTVMSGMVRATTSNMRLRFDFSPCFSAIFNKRAIESSVSAVDGPDATEPILLAEANELERDCCCCCCCCWYCWYCCWSATKGIDTEPCMACA